MHEYRDEYLADPDALHYGALDDFATISPTRSRRSCVRLDALTVSVLLGAASLFGLVRLSRLLSAIADEIPGRMLVLFPGTPAGVRDGLAPDGYDGWNYLAVPIN